MSSKENINVILMTGITNTVSSEGQAQLFLDGYGNFGTFEDEGVLYFGHTEIQKLLSSLIKYPNVPIVLYSAAGKYAPQVAKAVNDKSKIFVIEPWVGNDNRLKSAIDAIANGIPSTNYQIGPDDYRGDGIPNASQTPSGLSHFEALIYAGEIVKSKYPPPPPEPPTQPILFIGKIIDASTKDALPYVNIPINQNGTFTGKGLTTDIDGLISSSQNLTVGTYDFEITLTGYVGSSITKQVLATTKEINLNTIELSEDIKLLESVEVTAESFKGTIIDKNSKNPIPEATILSDTDQKDKATSQTDGSFSINIQFDETYLQSTPSETTTQIYKIISSTGVELNGTITIEDLGFEKQAITNFQDTTPDGIPVNYNFEGEPSLSSTPETLAKVAIVNLNNTLEGTYGIPGNLAFKSIQVEVPQDDSEKKYKQITAIVSAENYSQSDPIQLIRGDGSFIKDLGYIKLTPIEEELEEQIIENKTLTETQKSILEEGLPKDFISSLLKKLFRTIQDRLIPTILKMVVAFGVTKFNEEVLKNISNLPKTCPSSLEKLNKIIDKKNKLTKQLNNLYTSINSINKVLEIPPITIDIAEKATLAAKIYVGVQSFIPSTVTTPNPVGPVLIAKDLIEKFEDLIENSKSKLGGGTIQLKLIIEELRKVLLLLNILDALIQSCAEEIGGPTQNQTLISNELLKSTQQQSQQLSPVVTNVNGFEMGVITVDNITIGGLKRRRAVARNKQGVIMLQGEPSFSSNDQILIDELVFYIQQNDLKA
tara:strand:- start:6839 stop:9139 length:2301 start_codon:yes stop_codon:yes gene_type:complete